jgi:hypothetical protein
MRLFLASLFTILLTTTAAEPQRYTFASVDHIITMDVRFSDPYLGKRLAFYDDAVRKEICLVGNGEAGACPQLFVGIVATVTFRVKRTGGNLRGKTSVREYVTVTAQSPDLPQRPPFERTQVLTHGAISDLQVFGYDESDIAEGERDAERQKSKERLWRLCRQELYLNDETAPFAIIKWRFTLDAIEIASVQGR